MPEANILPSVCVWNDSACNNQQGENQPERPGRSSFVKREKQHRCEEKQRPQYFCIEGSVHQVQDINGLNQNAHHLD